MLNYYVPGVPMPYVGYDSYGRPQQYPYRYENNPDYFANQPNGNMAMQQGVRQTLNQQPNFTCIQVPDIEYAKKVFVAPNQIVYMFCQNKPELYAKATDSVGVGPIRCFKLVEFQPPTEQTPMQANEQRQDVVLQEEFNNFVNVVKTTLASIQENMLSKSELQEQLQHVEAYGPPKSQIKKQSKNERTEPYVGNQTTESVSVGGVGK